ncbi:hypothetical protein JOD54_000430 [Actinokineospora baliensis]|uniref:hypothetical protein n=1 Tax=Actinokineospora baliensis TaxID=547056 RepID=UPI00195C4A48|nr:hypothetical protein [Actinokineospora baliensis]MBM7770226.1 hypothetical protein [Actinokineospora baliensis]
MSVRPTLRCLRDELGLEVPPVTVPLNEVDHPLVRKANDQFSAPSGPRERIRAVDDTVMFKVKVRRWRGALVDAGEPSWLVAAGIREDGSRDDFYAALAESLNAARIWYNAEHAQSLATQTYSAGLLPTVDDKDRYRAEAGVRLLRELRAAVHGVVHASLLDGYEHTSEISGAELGVVVRAAEDNATYVALRIVGSVPDDLVAVVLSLVPGCDRDGWYPEFAMPERQLRANEQAYSNLMDPVAAAELLEARDGA